MNQLLLESKYKRTSKKKKNSEAQTKMNMYKNRSPLNQKA